MRLPYNRKRLLNIVILGSLLGIVVGLAPTLKQRIDEWTGLGGEATETLAARDVGAAADGARALSPGFGPETDRRLEQVQILPSELAARERDLTIREELLRRRTVEGFWKRQASAAVASIALSVLVVLLLARKIIERTGYPEQMRQDESRLRGMQLSVIGALEEFESEVAAARAWATEEAHLRSRHPAPAAAPVRAARPQIQALPVQPSAEPQAAAPAQADTDAPAPETVWEAARRALHNANLDEPIGPPVMPAERMETPPPAPMPEPVWQARSTMTEQPAIYAEPPETQSVFEAPPEEADPEFPAPQPGPWEDAHRRPGNVPQPAQRAQPLRAQVEYLAGEGFSETEIARRLSLSREEVQLAINLSRGKPRAAAPAVDVPVWSNARGVQG